MAEIDTGVIYHCESPAELEMAKVADGRNVKVVFSAGSEGDSNAHSCHNNSGLTHVTAESTPLTPSIQIRKDKVVPNGCLKHKLGENGLVSHGMTSVVTEPSVKEKESSPHVVLRDRCTIVTCPCVTSMHLEKLSLSENLKPESAEETEQEIARDSSVGSDLSVSETQTHSDIQEGIEYVVYESELQMPDIMRLITKDLSEPYSIYTYRYFIHNWPKLCFLAMSSGQCVGAIVCKLDMHKKMVRRGYIAMLAIDSEYRRKKIGSHLVLKAIKAMIADDCDEVVLETEITNKAALRLYENLGFVRDKRLFRYYLNGVDALRLKLWLR
ncbi:N-alpha-acetyltransferase 30-like [Liolophura sinensis]|uniref:N-alpha-acetyltransferase 30-like n=1 Tax=Liolophura sinensis TaxID=3198878 RepID=UPI0031581084